MPNWTTNYLSMPKKVALQHLVKKEGDRYDFDFNTLIPMPEAYEDLEAGSRTDEAIVVFLTDCLTCKPEKEKHKLLYALVENLFTEDWAGEVYKRCLKYSPEEMDVLYNMGRRYVENYAKYGATTWYDWCCNNWGTKWNACDTELIGGTLEGSEDDESVEIQFSTAWSMPMPIAEELARRYPESEMRWEYEYEDSPNELWCISKNRNSSQWGEERRANYY